MRWTETEYQALLNAIEKGGSTKGVIEMATQATNRSNESVNPTQAIFIVKTYKTCC